jgi:hypothetical protein
LVDDDSLYGLRSGDHGRAKRQRGSHDRKKRRKTPPLRSTSSERCRSQ